MAATINKKRKPTRRKAQDRLVQRMTKTTDNKGRVAFGGDFANKHVIIERISATEMLVKMARVIPESEAWLYDNAVALNAVRRGLAQARTGQLIEGPDMDAGAALVAKLKD